MTVGFEAKNTESIDSKHAALENQTTCQGQVTPLRCDTETDALFGESLACHVDP